MTVCLHECAANWQLCVCVHVQCAAACEMQGIKYRILQCVWYGTKKPAGNACRDQPRPSVMKVCKGLPCAHCKSLPSIYMGPSFALANHYSNKFRLNTYVGTITCRGLHAEFCGSKLCLGHCLWQKGIFWIVITFCKMKDKVRP
jgi:hypothetical protein